MDALNPFCSKSMTLTPKRRFVNLFGEFSPLWGARPTPPFLRPCSCVETRTMAKVDDKICRDCSSRRKFIDQKTIDIAILINVIPLFCSSQFWITLDEITRKQFFRQIATCSFEFLSFYEFLLRRVKKLIFLPNLHGKSTEF
jgi:hypothetical protein